MQARCDLLNHPFWPLSDITTPEAQNVIPAFCQVGILGYVKGHPLALAMVGIGILILFSVPIITVELDDGVVFWQEGVNRDFVRNQCLLIEWHLQRFQNGISRTFQPIGAKSLLSQIHFAQTINEVGIFVATFRRTVSGVGLFYPRWRPPKFLTTNLTVECYLIPTLPSGCAFCRTESSLIKTAPWNIERLTAPFTGLISTIPSLGALGSLSTFRGTVLLTRIKEWLKYLAANLARAWFMLSRSNALALARTVGSCTLGRFRTGREKSKLLSTCWTGMNLTWPTALGNSRRFTSPLAPALLRAETLRLWHSARESFATVFTDLGSYFGWHTRIITQIEQQSRRWL